MRTVGPNQQVAVNVTGPQVFGSGTTGLFAVLAQISSDLRSSNPANIANLSSVDIDNLDVATNNMQNTVASVGARYSRLDILKTQSDNKVVSLKGNLSAVEDIDLPKTITDLQLQQTAYQAALA